MSTLPPAAPPLMLDVPPLPFFPARAEPPAAPLTFMPLVPPLPDPTDVPDVVFVFCEADVLWFVVALGLIVTLLWGIALKLAVVSTDVLAFGATIWPAVVLVVLLALLRLRPRPLPDPTAVPEVVFVFCEADVLWLVVPLGLIVTLL